MFKLKNKIISVLLSLFILFSFSPAYSQTDNVVKSLVSNCVCNIVGIESGAVELDLTSTESLNDFLNARTSGSYSCSANWFVLDLERKANPVRANTAPFYGGRRVENICLYSQDLSNGAWNNTGVVLGTPDQFQANSQNDRTSQSITTIEGHTYRASVCFYVETSGGNLSNYSIRHSGAASGDSTSIATLSYNKVCYSTTFNGKVGGGAVFVGFIDGNASNWAVINITNFMIEDVTGQNNQNPSDHILTTSATVAEYYTTENGNTVSSNVVTEATGDPIENIIMLALWPGTKNEVPAVEYRDFTHANWAATNGSITAGNVTLIDGTVVADKNTFTASAANATLIKSAFISVSGVHAGGFFIKRKTGTGTVEVCVDNGATWVDVTTQVDSDSGWHLAQTTLPTVTDPQIGVRLVTDTDAVYLDMAQLDDGYARVSSHPIVGGATITGQDLHFSDDGLISNTKGSVYTEVMLLPDNFSILNASIVNNGQDILYAKASDNDASSNDGTNTLEFNNSLDGYTKVAGYWWDVYKQISADGSSVAAGTYDGAWGTGGIYIGNKSGLATGFNGGISKVIFDQNQYGQSHWETETTETCWIPIGNVRVFDSEGVYLEDESGECIYTGR